MKRTNYKLIGNYATTLTLTLSFISRLRLSSRIAE